MSAAGPLPELYARWMAEALPEPLRGEPRATCEDCAMCREGVQPFRPDVVCCGYLPELPNFAVGRILRDGGPAAVASVRGRLNAKAAVSPLGMGVPLPYAATWQHVQRTTGFGSEPELICPHFDRGRCLIWRDREAVCTTWFCRIDDGDAGREVWRTVRALLQGVERDLTRWVARENGLPEDGSSWGAWSTDRERWFMHSAEAVESLSWKQIRALGGFGLGVRLREVKGALLHRQSVGTRA